MLKSVCEAKECILIYHITIHKLEKTLTQIRIIISLKCKKYSVNYINDTCHGIQNIISGICRIVEAKFQGICRYPKNIQGIYRCPKLFRVSTDTLKFQGIYRYPDSTDTR